ncbi:hypothetical protein ACSNOI_05590 [Actinomadura kijaniata]|uniref:hypothetical protein n=1 Tax=Actinomadura kijaniata TaxID=46161 RepID=UPI003F19EBAA
MNVRTTFHCARCDAVLTGALLRVPMPRPGYQPYHEVGFRPVLMTHGTYAIDRDGTYVLAPGDVSGTRLVPERCADGCIGIHAEDGVNLVCASCGADIGGRTDACDAWQETRLPPGLVRAEDEPTDEEPWENPDEPFGRAPVDDAGDLDWLWFGRLGVCATEVLVRSQGRPVHFAGGGALVIRDFLRGMLAGTGHADAMRALGPGERPEIVCDLGGPGRAPVAVEGARSLTVVPGAPDEGTGDEVAAHPRVWAYLAHEHDRPPRGAGRWWDEEAPRRVSPAETRSHGLNWRCHDLPRHLAGRPEAAHPWLRDLLARIDAAWRTRFS